jgi:hypothetical protein
MSGDNIMSPLDSVPTSFQFALAIAPAIKDIHRVPYPEGIKRPNVRFDIDAKDGRLV